MPLHPQAQAFVDQLEEENSPAWEDLPVQEARTLFDSFDPMFGEGPSLHRVEDHVLADGINARLYSDRSDDSPAIVFFHGGGWVLGSVATHDSVCRRLAKDSGCAVISVEYGLAPENRFPGPVHDCYRATEDVVSRAGELGVDPHRIAVAGDSAGGQLAAAVSLRARDREGPKLALQVLIYPVIEPNFATASYQAFESGFGLTRNAMQWFWQQFLGDQPVTPLASPIRAESLQDLPPALILTAEYDVLRDEGEAFAERLRQHGVDVDLRRCDGMLHGFIHFAGMFDTGIEVTREIASGIQCRLNA